MSRYRNITTSLEMMGYELEHREDAVIVRLIRNNGEEYCYMVTPQELVSEDYVIERIVRAMNDYCKYVSSKTVKLGVDKDELFRR